MTTKPEPKWPSLPPLVRWNREIGSVKFSILSDGFFRLDGGAMFGVVPKVVWSRFAPCDELNRVPLGTNVLLAESEVFTLIVDAGMGDRWDEKMRGIYNIERPAGGGLPGALHQAGVTPDRLTHVLLTHLHLDHTGCLSDEGGHPIFPRARHVVQQHEWDAARHPDVRSKPSYRTDFFEPVHAAGLFDFNSGSGIVLPGVEAIITPGHTKWHQSFLFRTGGETIAFLGDIVPTAWHLKPAWTLGFDLHPADVIVQREALLKRAMEENWLVIFGHDPTLPCGRIRLGEKGFHVLPEPGTLG